MSILVLLIQFVFRVTFGVAFAMGITPSRWVSSGFYRVHLWVLMGFNTLASLCLYTQRESFQSHIDYENVVLGLAIGLAVLSYVGAVFWLYEKTRPGTAVLFAVLAGGLAAAAFATPWHEFTTSMERGLAFSNLGSSGLLLGATLTAMFLGHWYLNSPTMELRPLKRLVLLMAAAVIIRAAVSGIGLALQISTATVIENVFWIFVAFRWLAGIFGVFMMALLTWYCLKVPNTQSATGILYAGVILAFIGELSSQFLSSDAMYPL